MNPRKLRLYESLYTLNRGFEITLLSLNRIRQLDFFRREFLDAYTVMIEHTRAQANEELIHSLRDFEQQESFRFDQLQRQWEQQNSDPDDVFFAVQNRRDEIKEQMRGLQAALKRQRPRARKKAAGR